MAGWKQQLFGVIATVLVLLFVGTWTAVIIVAAIGSKGGTEMPTISSALVVTAGTLATTIATVTSAALGFTIATIKATGAPTGNLPSVTFKKVSAQAGLPIFWATIAYIAVGVAVLITWLCLDKFSPEIIATFAFSILGWLAGGAGVAFREPPE